MAQPLPMAGNSSMTELGVKIHAVGEAGRFAGSKHLGVLPRGCTQCREGAKMVVFITGLCPSTCFYCPVSEEKIDHDVIYANERRLSSDDDLDALVEEARLTNAKGSGITGGDPLVVVDRVVKFVSHLKKVLGPSHHTHLYTQQYLREDVAARLAAAGLDEIRFHPHEWLWGRFEGTPYAASVRNARAAGIEASVEVPCIPGRASDILHMAREAARLGATTLNMNELEYSPVNADALRERDYLLEGDESNAVEASRATGLEVLARAPKEAPGVTVHFCSSRYKDKVQLTKRLGRRARNVGRPYHEVTEEGTLVTGLVEGPEPDLLALYERLASEFEVPVEWMGLVERKGRMRLEVAPWVLEEVAGEFSLPSFIIEEYPTADPLEVEREDLRAAGRRAPAGALGLA